MSVLSHVKIGPHFFANEFADYSDWHFAWAREIVQNGVDAPGCSTISVSIQELEAGTVIVVTNDGCPMTEDVLVNKLLALGESGKKFSGTVGGFGKAKTLLMFCHQSWSVRTGTILASGIGGDYRLTTDLEYFHGTTTVVTMKRDNTAKLIEAFRKLARFTQWSGTLTVNDEILPTSHHKGLRRRDFDFGAVYTNKSDQYKLVVRIGGIPMFTRYCGLNRCVVVELNGASNDVLTANRDGMLFQYSSQLDAFITLLATDKRKALRNRTPRYERFAGQKFVVQSVSARDLIQDADEDQTVVVTNGTCVAHGPVATLAAALANGSDGELAKSQIPTGRSRPANGRYSRVSNEFVLKNETDRKIPTCYRPDMAEFSKYSQKLVRIWGRLMVKFHEIFEADAEFAIGFIFDDDTEAECEKHPDFGLIYYLNPTKTVEQSYSSSKSFSKRFKLTERGRLLSVAAHEFVHGLGYNNHSEEFASKYTEVMGHVLTHVSKFAWCFK